MRASIFYRIAAVLLLVFAVGHTLGFRQSDPRWGVDTLLGGRILCRRALSIRGDIGMAARRPSGSDFGAHARHCVGVRSLFCRHHSCELEIPFCHTHRFLDRDYIMFDCGGMAFSEADFHASVAIVRSEVRLHSTAAIACHKLYSTGP